MPTTGTKFKKHTIDGDPESPSYFDSKEFKTLCSLIVECVRKAEKKGEDATYRYLKESIGSDEWLFEAVERCKSDGLIEAAGAIGRTIFVIGGTEIKPAKSKGYNKGISVCSLPSQTNIMPDWYFENCNRI
jgi:hypothetical protein